MTTRVSPMAAPDEGDRRKRRQRRKRNRAGARFDGYGLSRYNDAGERVYDEQRNWPTGPVGMAQPMTPPSAHGRPDTDGERVYDEERPRTDWWRPAPPPAEEGTAA